MYAEPFNKTNEYWYTTLFYRVKPTPQRNNLLSMAMINQIWFYNEQPNVMKYPFLILTMLSSFFLNAADKTWIGDVDSDWSDPLNWSDNTLPANGDDIFIDADDYTTAPIMTGNSPFTIDDITIRDNGLFTITGGTLTISDDMFVNDATFTISGGALDVDEISADNSTVNLTGGTITADGDLDANNGTTFNISTTVIQTAGDEDLEVGANSTFNISVGANITGFDDIDFDSGTGNGTFNMTGGILDLDDDFNVDNGPSNMVIISGGALDVADDILVDDATFTISGGTLDVDEITGNNNATINLTGGIITADGDLDANSGTTFNISTTVTQTAGDEDIEVGTNATFNILPGANITGFNDVDFDTNGGSGTFNMTGGTLEIDDDFKIQDGDDNVVTISGGTLDVGDDFEMETDNNQIIFNGTADIDFGGQFEFGASGGGTGNDATNSTVTVSGDATLDVVGGIDFHEGGSGLTTFLNIEGGSVTADNIDDLSGVSVNISGGSSVNVGGSSLPVKLLAFTGYYQGEKVTLNWSTGSEINNDYFDVLRSRDGENFEKIARVEGNGTKEELTNYTFVDFLPQKEANYYRLLQVDFDGAYEYLPITFVSTDKLTKRDVSVYPNPSVDGLIKIRNSGFILDGNTELNIFDMYGSRVLSKEYDNSLETEIVEDLSFVKTGMYILSIKNNGRVLQKRIKLN